MQEPNGKLLSVAYASSVISKAKANSNVTELGCLAVVWAVKIIRPYLYGRKFTIVTDHSAQRWLMTSKDLAGRLHQWALALHEYNFEVHYRL